MRRPIGAHEERAEAEAVEAIAYLADLLRRGARAHRIDVMGGFIVGFDADWPEAFEAQRGIIATSPIPLARVGLLTAREAPSVPRVRLAKVHLPFAQASKTAT